MTATTNPSATGSRYERLCLAKLKAHFSSLEGYTLKKEWHTQRGGWKHGGGNDFLETIDIALLYHREYNGPYTIMVQVKDIFRQKVYDELRDIYAHVPFDVFYATYRNKNPTKHVPKTNTIIEKPFILYQVN